MISIFLFDEINISKAGAWTTGNYIHINPYLFYHDVDEIAWPQPIRSLKLGHVTGQWSMFPTGRDGCLTRENSFQYCIFQYIFKIKV